MEAPLEMQLTDEPTEEEITAAIEAFDRHAAYRLLDADGHSERCQCRCGKKFRSAKAHKRHIVKLALEAAHRAARDTTAAHDTAEGGPTSLAAHSH
ncbi:MAG: hypothetical protein LKJ18_00870 [Ancrocorticia sp.]|jgi:uncharacterized C2H2 Zn-finger protein|nr:hypothetical protein [Ancrocorticia sp.]MCI2002031.1 hypothetical protein [Ancrocorticia sp.]